jgi:uncharacterized peroxidase-related enzyme
VQAHTNDLRAEVAQEWNTLSTTPVPDEAGLDAFVHQIVEDWRAAPLSNAVRALAEFAEQVTRQPEACTAAILDGLREAGWCDASVHDVVQVVAYYNYMNRVALALGVEPEKQLRHWGPTRL